MVVQMGAVPSVKMALQRDKEEKEQTGREKGKRKRSANNRRPF